MRQNPPLQGKYAPTVAFVLLALCPDLFFSTAMPLIRPSISQQLHASPNVLQIGETFSDAGWAFGAVLASDLAQRFHNYRLNLIYEAVFVIGSILGAVAPSAPFVIAGRILQGTATGMLLVSALPPLIRNFGVEKLSSTATFTDIGLFGAVAAGPLIGGYVATTGTWRWLFATSGLLALLGFILVLLVVKRDPGYNPDMPLDFPAIVLAAAGAGLTFYGVGEIQTATWSAPIVWIPTVLGLLLITILIVYQYRRGDNALMPVKPISSTYPIMGITAGVLSGAAFTGLLELVFLFLQFDRSLKPLGIGLSFWPMLATSLLAAVIFGKVFSSRYVLLQPLVGMVDLVIAAWLLTTTTTGLGTGLMLWVAGLLGLGAGLTVSPGLFIAALSVRANLVGRAFALVELLRLAGAFALVPAFLYFGEIYGMQPQKFLLGAHIVFWVILIGLVCVIALITLVFFIGGARIHSPNVRAYLERGEPAFESPPFAAALSRSHPEASISTSARSIFDEEGSAARQEQRRQALQDGKRPRDQREPRKPEKQRPHAGA